MNKPAKDVGFTGKVSKVWIGKLMAPIVKFLFSFTGAEYEREREWIYLVPFTLHIV